MKMFKHLALVLLALSLNIGTVISQHIEARQPHGGATGAIVTGYDGVIQENSAGKFVNLHGQPIGLRGGNFSGMNDQPIQGFWTAAYYGSALPPDWTYYQTWKPNIARLLINPQSFAGYTINVLTGTGTGPYTWSASTYAADPAGNYKNFVAQFILNARAAQCYVLIDAHETAPQFTDSASVTHWLGGVAQSPFADQNSVFPYWTSNNPSIGIVAWLATNFGSAAFNTANGFNSGAAGQYYNASYGGTTGFGDIIFELFNEPYLDNQAFTLTTIAGTFGNAAWRANNSGSNYTTTNGGTPPSVPSGGGFYVDNTAGASFVKLYGGFANWFYLNSSCYVGNGSNRGIPNGSTGPASQTCGLDLSWQIVGYQQLLTGIRALGATNIIQVNGDGYASTVSNAAYWMPDDTLSPRQISIGIHPYSTTDGGQSTGSSYPNSFDPNSGTAAWYNWPSEIVAGTLPYKNGGTMPATAVLFSEYGSSSGASNTQPDPFMTQVDTYVDSLATGQIGVTVFLSNQPGACCTYPLTAWEMSVFATTGATFTGTVDNGSGAAGTILTVTSTPSSTITVGMMITGGFFSSQSQYNSYIVSQISGTAGGTGKYQLNFPDGSTLLQGSTSFTAQMPTTVSGQSQTVYTWMFNHL